MGFAAVLSDMEVLQAARNAEAEILSAQRELEQIEREKAALGGGSFMFSGWGAH